MPTPKRVSEEDEEFEDCGHDWDMSCPPCRVCPECGDCDCGIDDSDDDNWIEDSDMCAR